MVDLRHPDVQRRIVEKAITVSKCGLYDGIFLDGWKETYGRLPGDVEAMQAILQSIRDNVRPDFLIMVNPNTTTIPSFAPYVNGLYMESQTPYDNMQHGGIEEVDAAFQEIEDTLKWAEENLRPPRINRLAGWGFPDETAENAINQSWVRALTTLTLTFSDGYIFYVHPYKGEYKRFWYNFWNADLGHSLGKKSQLYEGISGLYIREFTNGWAVYNHSGEAHVITLPEQVQGVSSGLVNTEHALPNLDGEIYLRVKPADVNGDGVVNIFDLTLVVQAMGTDKRREDVNGDGVVNVFDLEFVEENLKPND